MGQPWITLRCNVLYAGVTLLITIVNGNLRAWARLRILEHIHPPTIKEERLEIQSGVQSHKIKLFEGTPQLARTSAT